MCLAHGVFARPVSDNGKAVGNGESHQPVPVSGAEIRPGNISHAFSSHCLGFSGDLGRKSN